MATPSQAAASFWQGGISDDWFTALNWVWDGVVPGAGDQARIDSATDVVVGAGQNGVAGQLWLGVMTTGAGLTVNGTLTTDNATLGYNAGSGGVVVLSGGAAKWTNNAGLIVGEAGTGLVDIKNGADLVSAGAILGGSAPGNLGSGTVKIDGLGSTWEDSGRIRVGNYGTGTLELTHGGTLTSSGGLVGSETGSTGYVTIDGIGSSWTATGDGLLGRGTIQVGNAGNGHLVVRNGGTISDVDGYVGSESGSNSTATISGIGATWTNSRDFLVAHNAGAAGTVTVSQGGALSAAANMQIGNLAGSTGSMTVTGSGSQVTVGGDLNVGWHGNGTLNVLDGGKVTATSATNSIYVANENDATGTVLIDGTGSELSSARRIFIGAAGTGELTLRNGGMLSAATGVRIAAEAHSTGVLNIGAAAGVSAAAAGAIVTPVIQFGPDGGGKIVFNATDAGYDLGAKISGNGSIDIYAGNLALSGANSYSGGTRVRAGTLTLGTSSAAGTGTITLDGGSTLAYASGVTIANNLAIGGVVDLKVNSGTATQLGNLTIASGGLYRLRGNGVLQFNGTTTSASGQTSISDGTTVSVNGTLAGLVVVGNAGTLKGNGAVGATIVNAGGTVAPGNSIGTLSVVGDVTFNPGSTYEVETNGAGASDRINATGTAFLNGGTVSVLPAGGVYAPSTVYTILSADKVTGAFGGVTSNLAFLVPGLSYDAKNVYLTLVRNGSTFGSVGQTANQVAAAAGVESMSDLTIANVLVGLTAADARSAFDALSGEVHATTTAALIETSSLPRNAVLDRLDQAFDSAESSNLSQEFALGTGVWGTLYGLRQDQYGNSNAAASSSSAGGFAGGIDGILNDWRLGAMIHAGSTAINVSGRNSSADVGDYGFGIYGGTNWDETQFSFGATYTRHDINTRRSVTFPGFNEVLLGSYAGGTAQVFGELARELNFGAATLIPFANLAYVLETTDAFAERGGVSALGSAARTEQALFATIGMRGDYAFAMDSGALVTVSGALGWRHAFADTVSGQHNFATGTAFAASSAPITQDVLQLGAGLKLDLNDHFNVGVSYDGQLSNQGAAHALRLGLTGTF